jgi:hypothetical protein
MAHWVIKGIVFAEKLRVKVLDIGHRTGQVGRGLFMLVRDVDQLVKTMAEVFCRS